MSTIKTNPIAETNFSGLMTGFYTIVFPAHNTHRTIKIFVGKYGHFEGKILIAKMIGNDNMTSYKAIANISDNGKLCVWKKSGLDSLQVASLAHALKLIMGDAPTYGREYAMRSSNCWKCNHLLTTPDSIERGIGPECAKKI